MHGGLSPDLKTMEQIRRIVRPTDVPDTGLLCDLLWSDPNKEISGWGENDRGVSYTYGPDIVTSFLKRQDLDLICRAHQVVEDGYEFFAKRQLVTLFSAPNYCGEFDNAGAMMSVDETLMCSFQVGVFGFLAFLSLRFLLCFVFFLVFFLFSFLFSFSSFFFSLCFFFSFLCFFLSLISFSFFLYRS